MSDCGCADMLDVQMSDRRRYESEVVSTPNVSGTPCEGCALWVLTCNVARVGVCGHLDSGYGGVKSAAGIPGTICNRFWPIRFPLNKVSSDGVDRLRSRRVPGWSP